MSTSIYSVAFNLLRQLWFLSNTDVVVPAVALVDTDGNPNAGSFDVAAPTMTRPADTTAYASGDLIANSTTAGSVVPLAFAGLGATVGIVGARIRKSTTSLTNAQVRLHLFSSAPTVSVGDNAAFDSTGALGIADAAGYLGYIDMTFDTSGTAGASARGVPTSPSTTRLVSSPASGGLWGLLEARAAYTPGNAETFDVSLQGSR